jgi:hypothetical protein
MEADAPRLSFAGAAPLGGRSSRGQRIKRRTGQTLSRPSGSGRRTLGCGLFDLRGRRWGGSWSRVSLTRHTRRAVDAWRGTSVQRLAKVVTKTCCGAGWETGFTPGAAERRACLEGEKPMEGTFISHSLRDDGSRRRSNAPKSSTPPETAELTGPPGSGKEAAHLVLRVDASTSVGAFVAEDGSGRPCGGRRCTPQCTGDVAAFGLEHPGSSRASQAGSLLSVWGAGVTARGQRPR